MDLSERVTALGKLESASTPVVTVYLGTRWADEHQRDRVRIFLKNELAQARRAAHPRAAQADLDWIEAQGEALLNQTTAPDAGGVALFACEALRLREVLPSRIAFENAFAVGGTPFLRPLMELHASAPTTLVVFIDMESARLVTLTPAGVGEEVALAADMPGQHSRGGWAQMAESRYKRHIEDHRARHFEAVAATLVALADGNGVRRIVLAGDPRNVAGFRKEVPPRIAAHIVGTVAGARHEGLRQLRALNLQPANLALRGRHPALGTVTLGQLLATWAAHDLTHLHQIARVLAHQCREAVGPWSVYLGVLRCSGRSA